MDIFMGIGETIIINTHLGLIKIESSTLSCDGQKQAPRAIAIKVTPVRDTRVQEQRHDDYTFLVRGDPHDVLNQWLRPAEMKSG